MLRRCAFLPLLFLGVVSCNSSNSTTSGSQSSGLLNGTFVATMNGTQWTATGRVVVQPFEANSLIVSATSPTWAVGLTIVGPAANTSYSLKPQPGVFSSLAILTNAGNSWTTAVTGGTGTINVTTYTSSRIAGTFSFTPVSSTAAPTATVTAGSFDVTY